jgi:tetratricopeptide (TPR) repeat protein
MTANHQLLYRITELMLNHEQHVLPVDLLFDDDEIGDYVKSIQIDSPYQQMLLEGVLTESVREEKLYLSFTVEGYFHYMLGEVIYNLAEGSGGEVLKVIVEGSKLNGAKEGVEQCLIRDVQMDYLSRLISCVSMGGEILDCCILPFMASFIRLNAQYKTDAALELALNKRVESILKILLKSPSVNEISILTRVVSKLKEIQKVFVVKIIYKKIITILKPDEPNRICIILDSLSYLQDEKNRFLLQDSIAYINTLDTSIDLGQYYSKLGAIFATKPFVDYDLAINYFEKSISAYDQFPTKSDNSLANCYDAIGLCWMSKGDSELSMKHHLKALEIRLKINHDYSSISCDTIALSYLKLNEFDKAIFYFVKALDIKLRKYGPFHLVTGSTYSALAMAHTDNLNYEAAIECWQIYLKVCMRLKHKKDQSSLVFEKLGWLYYKTGDWMSALEFTEKALSINVDKGIVYYQNERKLALFAAKILLNLGLRSYKNAMYFDSLGFYEKSYEYIATFKDANELDVVLYGLASAHLKIGNIKKAEEFYLSSLDIRINKYVANHQSIGRVYNGLGNVKRSMKLNDEAIIYYNRAYEIFHSGLGENHKDTQIVKAKLKQLNNI